MKRAADYVTYEQNTAGQLSATFFIASISGFISYFIQTHGVWQQWTYLAHTFVGLYLSLIIAPYIYAHFRRTLGLRRPIVLISGILSLLVIISLIVSGIHIATIGQQESLRWIYQMHLIGAFSTVVLLFLHLFLHRVLLPKKRKQSEETRFTSLPPKTFVYSAYAVMCCLGIVVLLSISYSLVPSSYSDEARNQPYEYSYGEHPFRPSQTETISGGFLDARRITGSDKCGTCHAEITKQWKASIHSQAGSDKTYQTNINLLAEKKGIAATRYCEGCHVPSALLSGELSKGGRLDTQGHLLEGVSCMACHGIDRIEHIKGVASYRFAPQLGYLFEESDNFIATKIKNYLIRIQPRQHRRDMSRDVIKSPKICGSCHAQFMDKDVNNWGWVKMQDEYSTWLKSPYSQQSEQSYSNKEQKRCQDCHMPLELLDDPSADHQGLAVSHTSLGANTAIPWYNGDTTHLAQTIDFLRSNKVRVTIEKPNRSDATRSEKFINPSISNNTETPAYYYLGEDVSLKVVLSNVGVGHDFPGGTTDINEVWINLNIVDSQNNPVYSSGVIDSNNDVDPNAYFYRSIAVDRQGNHVWKHDLFNMVGDSFKKVIPAGESDIVEYKFNVPSWVKGPLTASATVKYRKFNNRYARWALQDASIQLPIVDVARTSITVPIRMRKEVEQTTVSLNSKQDSNEMN